MAQDILIDSENGPEEFILKERIEFIFDVVAINKNPYDDYYVSKYVRSATVENWKTIIKNAKGISNIARDTDLKWELIKK